MFTVMHTILTEVTTQDRTRQELETLVGELAKVEAHAIERRLAATTAIDALDDGGTDGADVTRAKARRSSRDAKKAAKTANALDQMPRTRAALARGEITEAHADAAAEAAERVSPAEADSLADDAANQPADLFGKQARSWASAREREEKKADRQARLRAAREVSTWTDANGMWCLFGRFDPETGQELKKALGQVTDQMWRDDGGRAGRPDEIRTPEQRRADAVHELMVRPVAAGTGKRPHPKHLVGVRVDASRCTSDNPTGVAEFIDGTPLPQSTLERIACGAEFVGMVFGADGETLWQGRRQRLATEAQWANLIARDGGCFCCGADPVNCEAHHIVAWEPPSRGPTDIDNLVITCRRTHHLVHDQGHQILWIDGKWTLAPPSQQRRAA
jgi:hypothetical protein